MSISVMNSALFGRDDIEPKVEKSRKIATPESIGNTIKTIIDLIKRRAPRQDSYTVYQNSQHYTWDDQYDIEIRIKLLPKKMQKQLGEESL